jgi:hypothetical protein
VVLCNLASAGHAFYFFLCFLCRWCARQIGRLIRPRGSVCIQQQGQVQCSQLVQAPGAGEARPVEQQQLQLVVQHLPSSPHLVLPKAEGLMCCSWSVGL